VITHKTKFFCGLDFLPLHVGIMAPSMSPAMLLSVPVAGEIYAAAAAATTITKRKKWQVHKTKMIIWMMITEAEE